MPDYPWPEEPERVESRVRGLVLSVLDSSELRSCLLDWVAPSAHRFDRPNAGWVALRLTVAAEGDEVYQREIWNADRHTSWGDELSQLASDLEDWVCETSFAWGQERTALVPD